MTGSKKKTFWRHLSRGFENTRRNHPTSPAVSSLLEITFCKKGQALDDFRDFVDSFQERRSDGMDAMSSDAVPVFLETTREAVKGGDFRCHCLTVPAQEPVASLADRAEGPEDFEIFGQQMHGLQAAVDAEQIRQSGRFIRDQVLAVLDQNPPARFQLSAFFARLGPVGFVHANAGDDLMVIVADNIVLAKSHTTPHQIARQCAPNTATPDRPSQSPPASALSCDAAGPTTPTSPSAPPRTPRTKSARSESATEHGATAPTAGRAPLAPDCHTTPLASAHTDTDTPARRNSISASLRRA